ncbi:MAG TPA: regulatory protein RecX [Steroidobacteraceae bacterium]|nr:regulatory protein RecX [Steroidobacteraceae bacterium]
MKLLARRDFAGRELHARLVSLGFASDAIAAILHELTEERLLDEVRFTENYVAYHARRGQGPVRITASLEALGVPQPLIAAALAAGPDWTALARAARARRFGPRAPHSRAERARQGRFLQYRGFSADHIRSALDQDSSLDE